MTEKNLSLTAEFFSQNVVHSESEGTDLLLQDDGSRQLEQFAKNYYHNVRWNFSSERKKLAAWTANKKSRWLYFSFSSPAEVGEK